MGQGNSAYDASKVVGKAQQIVVTKNYPLPEHALSRIKMWHDNGLDDAALHASALLVLCYLYQIICLHACCCF